MNHVVESIRLEWCRRTGYPFSQLAYFYRDHIGSGYACKCDLYFELLDACPIRIPFTSSARGKLTE